MHSAKNTICLVLSLSLLVSSGCTQRSALPRIKTDIERDFLKSFNATFKPSYPLYTSTKTVGKTLWVYIAVEKDLLTVYPGQKVTAEKIIKFFEMNCDYESTMFDADYIFLNIPMKKKAEKKIYCARP